MDEEVMGTIRLNGGWSITIPMRVIEKRTKRGVEWMFLEPVHGSGELWLETQYVGEMDDG